jgi:hypothetical protein
MFRRHAIVMSGICVMLMNYLQGDNAGIIVAKAEVAPG